MSVLTPSAWEGISTVTVVILLALFVGLSLIRGWIVFGPHHREIVRVKDEVIADVRGTRLEDQQIIRSLSDTVNAQRVNGEVSAHLLQAMQNMHAAPDAGGGPS
ncbi:hypothetical protein [Rhodococcus sp. IEGM 1379]|uniref:hypothetical protein n=1 Tax=Rhodococcus sp. IEGM 1379 TaxID=3047086 RepID=UPI0024B6AE9F|nr:hypothetical protein [Rhodococcus sp. IEGM 1379]MDI9914363.1 hypothetical protein [Rhodococcus sp. IEGM 1379]